ncbi:MAG TPA: transposase family protein [Gammaproteobacteria bacterium]|nr:transposase family protein [Gammaproteobacteria bacterium]
MTHAEKKCAHKLEDVIAITICAVICGADDWTAIESFGKAKSDWFSTFSDLPNEILSHDTLWRLFCIMSPAVFQAFFTVWVNAVPLTTRRHAGLDPASRKSLKALDSGSSPE